MIKSTDAVQGGKKGRPKPLNARDIVNLIKKEKRAVLGQLPDRKSAALVQAALVQIGRVISTVDEGVVRIGGIGGFRVRKVEREKDGKKRTVKRITFRAIKKKAGEKGKKVD